MDGRPIGVFDSGVGGLTVVRVLERLLPHEDIIYFGDSGRAPYGVRSAAEINALSEQDARFLSGFGVKAYLAACGTVSSNSLPRLRETFPEPFFGVVDAACRAVLSVAESGRIGVAATEASVASGAYERCLRALSPRLEPVPLACPELVTLVESGLFLRDRDESLRIVERSLRPFKGAGLRALVLGCTHYPPLSSLISRVLGDELPLISVSAEAAKELARHLADTGAQNTGGGRLRCFTSGDVASFEAVAEKILGHKITAERYVIYE